MNSQDLQKFEYDISNIILNVQEELKEELKIRHEFLKKFPLIQIPNLTLDKYVIGKKDTFCYWLEQKLDKLGRIRGGSTADKKFGVYYGKTKYDSVEKYRGIKKWGNSIDESFQNIRNEIENLLNAGKDKNLESISLNKISPLFKGKILSVYFPDIFLSIFAISHVEHFLEILGIKYDTTKIKSIEEKKELLVNFKNNSDYLKQLTNDEFVTCLYT